MFNGYRPAFWSQRIKHRHLVIFFLLLSVILLIISILGCSSSSAANPSLYLVEIQYDAYGQLFMKAGENGIVNADAYNVLNAYDVNSDLQVRIGYFGICTNSSYSLPLVVQNQLGSLAPKPSNATNAGWVCSSNATHLANEFTWPTQDALNLVYVANAVRTHSMTPWVLIIAIVLSGISCFLLILVHTTGSQAFPLTTGTTTGAFLFAVLGMTSQQTAINSISQMAFTLSQNSLKITTGKSAAGLGWAATAFLFLSSIALVLIFISEKNIRARDSDLESSFPREAPTKVSHEEEEEAQEVKSLIEAMGDKVLGARQRAAAEQAAEEAAIEYDMARRESEAQKATRDAAAREAASRQSAHNAARPPSPMAESNHFRMPGTISMPTPY
ncbi:hypothetical protein AWJ20_5262 [Sugiyamaella lignohabitans]|uniref:Actin cortical patch SUR7/pH-response regulator PalI n=1 Tax=Sugiyamaella lignohabitans TaxID=796027 RepID=A0A161HLL7_9ASCO|nr:uncharacterized protein AWJ20_5262 [Sugiyamaella lignohabitans]ANB14297.1 hypothetical protein AWJ20_5262 [Sugiyamaella lignohabitans]